MDLLNAVRAETDDAFGKDGDDEELQERITVSDLNNNKSATFGNDALDGDSFDRRYTRTVDDTEPGSMEDIK